ncbi:uncharacterized protein LOC116346061 [Contarinia nasturtii]|uniref:uncharacterized protein LOC116346061 n=1 Tax=Contarinia nasturtii TaxID=265458 RepID=UPI0012D40B68|nr:uncharacterized protein LOC116346061 [Contarinia nasturtii]
MFKPKMCHLLLIGIVICQLVANIEGSIESICGRNNREDSLPQISESTSSIDTLESYNGNVTPHAHQHIHAYSDSSDTDSDDYTDDVSQMSDTSVGEPSGVQESINWSDSAPYPASVSSAPFPRTGTPKAKSPKISSPKSSKGTSHQTSTSKATSKVPTSKASSPKRKNGVQGKIAIFEAMKNGSQK